MTDAAQYLRARGVARLVGVSERTVKRWIAEGTLPSVKIGGARLVAKSDLERLLSQGLAGVDEPSDESG